MSSFTIWMLFGVFGAILFSFTFIRQFMESDKIQMSVNSIVALTCVLILLLFLGVFSFGFAIVYAWMEFEIGKKKITIVRRKK